MWQKKLKKTIFTLNIGNYAPKITKLTYPLIEAYAKKIGAEFKIITQRRFPDYPVEYEKLQVSELGQDSDWIIFIDSDCLVHPDMFDITEVLPEDIILVYGASFAGGRFKYDNCFRRDGRNMAVDSFLTVASGLCIDLWNPPDDLTLEEARTNLFISEEKQTSKSGYAIDDYILSRNIAKYHLKFETFSDLLANINRRDDGLIFHEHMPTGPQKVERLKKALRDWNL